ncbi:MAG: hypothetical protein P4L28_08130 [Paludibacteraceae bacterium]|nr:hypothetical protein [Paludibacteraceae bacterium]
MIEETEHQQAQRLLQKALDLDNITDPAELKIAINNKLRGLNKIDEIALKMKLGQLQQEEKAGLGFQKRKYYYYVIIFLIALSFSVLSLWLLFTFNLILLWEIILWPFCIINALLSFRTLYKIMSHKF